MATLKQLRAELERRLNDAWKRHWGREEDSNGIYRDPVEAQQMKDKPKLPPGVQDLLDRNRRLKRLDPRRR